MTNSSISSVNRCRVCGHDFYPQPLLRYDNMPKAAQFMPDASALSQEHGVDLEVWQCAGCGLVQLANAPVPYYKEVVRAAAFSPEMGKFRGQQFAGFVESNNLANEKVLEVGCGAGEYLSIMAQCGARAFGIEAGAESVARCRAGGLRVKQGYIGDGQLLADGPFKAFFILNFLEHLPDINMVLQGIGRNLDEGGIGLVEVPNFDMILVNNLFSEFIGDHLFYFTQDTLRSTLALNGFEVVELKVIWHGYIISALVRKRSKTDLTPFQECQTRLTKELQTFISRFSKGKVAIWGAGHQALAVMSLTDLGDKICYVVDSAPFKQGKFTPASHIPIVKPETLRTDPVEAVIVMAASYSDEVAGIIKENYGNLTVAILRDYGLQY